MTQEADRTPPPHEGEEKPEYEPPAADEIARDDNVETAGILNTGKDAN